MAGQRPYVSAAIRPHYIHAPRFLAEELNTKERHGAFWANQFDNIANRNIHRQTTGPEIREQTAGQVDGFVCAAGTGGTLAGVAMALKAKNPDFVIALADPTGSSLYHYFRYGTLSSEGSSISEGIRNSRITKNLEGVSIAEAFSIPDEESLPIVFDLLQHEGLCVGGCSGVNVVGAIRLVRKLGPGHSIVTVLADSGAPYRQKVFNPELLRGKNLPVPG